MKAEIPRQFHFIFGLRQQDEPFHLTHYLCLESCRRINQPEKIYLYYHYEPFGRYWDLIKEYLILVKVELDPFVHNFKYPHKHKGSKQYRYAHHSDFVRLQKLLAHGGVYADIDTIFVNKIPDKLYEKSFVLGEEDPIYNTATGKTESSLCNAFIMSAPGAKFCELWLNKIKTAFDGSWSGHSTILPRKLSEKHPDLIHIEPSQTFYKYMWNRPGIERLLEKQDTDDLEHCVSIHLWSHLWWAENRLDFSSFHSGLLTEGFVRNALTTYNSLARPYLPEQKCFPEDGKVSVAIPMLDHPDFLRPAVYSILSQSYEDYEIIIINDGSSTAFQEQVDDVAALSPKISVFNKPADRKWRSNKEYGLEKASGRYFCFLNNDNFIPPDFFKAAIEKSKTRTSFQPLKNLFFKEKIVQLTPKTYLDDFFALMVLLLAGMKLVYGMAPLVEIGMHDETICSAGGAGLLGNDIFSTIIAPFYAAWYYFLNFIQPALLKLYYLNAVIIGVLSPIIFYAVMRVRKICVFPALLISSYFLISYANLPLYPKVTHFALLLTLISLMIATRIKGLANQILLSAVGALAISYLRPEFFLTFIVLMVLYIVFLALKKGLSDSMAKEIGTTMVLTTAISLLLITFGLPLTADGSRALIPFEQHFAANWSLWTFSGINPWMNHEQVAGNTFIIIQSVWDAITTHPILFFQRVVFNAFQALLKIPSLFFIHYNILLPVQSNFFWMIESAFIPLCIVALIASKWNFCKYRLKQGVTKNNLMLFIGIAYLLPVVLSSLITAPGLHSLLIPTMLLIIYLSEVFFTKHHFHRHWLYLAGFIILVSTPVLMDYHSSASVNNKSINFIHSLKTKKQAYLLSSESDDVHIAQNFKRVSTTSKNDNFNNAK